MRNAILIGLTVVMAFAGCGKKQPKKDSDDDGRSLASVQTTQGKTLMPISAHKFLLGEEQRLKPQQAIKHYANYMPADLYKRLLKLSNNVDDIGFSVKRNGNDMYLDNGKQSLKIKFLGSEDHLTILFDDEHFDFSKTKSVEKLLNKLESNINGSNHSASLMLFFKMCPFIGLLGASDVSHASNWFFVGGMAILGIAIAYAAYKFGNSIKKTEHTIKARGEVGLDQKTKDALNNLADSVKDANIDVNLDTNHNINLEVPKEATGLF